MNLNIHPIFVHFPIAFLSFYAVLELVRFKKIKEQPYWFYLKAILLFAGVLGGVVAGLTGAAAQGLVRDSSNRALINVHSSFAELSVFVFGVLAAGYLVVWLRKSNFLDLANNQNSFIKVVFNLAYFIVETKAVILIALVGLILITITGALGGAIVYGQNADPLVHYIYGLFF